MPTVFRANRIRLWSPASSQIQGALKEVIATSLAEAFSSREWTRTPMPVGDDSDPNSAQGIIATLGGRARLLLASLMETGIPIVYGFSVFDLL